MAKTRRGKQKADRTGRVSPAAEHSSNSSSNNNNDNLGGWLLRLWGGLRRLRDTPDERPENPRRGGRSRSSPPLVETGALIVGPVRDPLVAIPAEIMFTARRAALYTEMVGLALHCPYYLARVVAGVKYGESEGLLRVVLESLFAAPAYEKSLTAFTSLDNDLASVYQDWARTQSTRLPLVVSSVEAAGYTEVQNLSRRRSRHLSHLTTHFLYDIINAHAHIPQGLLAICTTTMRAAQRRFPMADEAQAYSLVGGIFFLRYVNAALLSPDQYGLLDGPPSAAVKNNLKLVARLLQRLSNNWGKPADEWPVDARKFMRSNARRFGLFLASLTDDAAERRGKLADPGAALGEPAGERSGVGVARCGECGERGGMRRRRECRDPGTCIRQCPAVRRAATKSDGTAKASAAVGGRQGSPGSSSCSSASASTGCSTHSMFNMGGGPARVAETPVSAGDVVMPLNDLYALQKYLAGYSDAWAPGEMLAQGRGGPAGGMQACLRELGPAPAPVPPMNNHRTRIKLH
ncbi:RasGAP protein [Coemansia interrupta]|uniref:RasGAP protein n=1 Tax=Coemansia interrupta TaxID=1126814 RepID=A0A9W8HB24_9FUNG|nr:RasGAP protein [Coemansia interrupta]